MIEIVFIRHGKTAGNLRKAYIGQTDEPLCAEGIKDIKGRNYPVIDTLYTSPMLRCRQTCEIIYPYLEAVIIPDFRECDFGIFEGKNYRDLNDSSKYQQWIDSGGVLPFPGGEAVELFQKRCIKAFDDLTCIWRKAEHSCGIAERYGIIAHGGTIMSIMNAFSKEKKSFYDWRVDNGYGYVCSLSETWDIGVKEIKVVHTL